MSMALVLSLVSGAPKFVQIIAVLAGLTGAILVLALLSTCLRRHRNRTACLIVIAIGALYSASPLLVFAVHGSWQSTFRSPSNLTGAGGGLVPIETYAQFAIVWGVAMCVVGAVCLGIASLRVLSVGSGSPRR